MNAIEFLVGIIFTLYLMVVLLRLWLQLAKADFYNPLSQFVVRVTHPIVGPLRRIIPSIGSFDTATLLLAFAIALLKIWVLAMLRGYTMIDPIGILVSACIYLLSEAAQLVIYVLIIRAILSWVSQGSNPLELLFHQLTEPLVAPIRRVVPSVGGLDLSPMILIILLMFVMKLVGLG